jgi:two-component system OmpR family response regulator
LGWREDVRILVIEDEPRLNTQLAASLAEAGYVVDAAADGRRADELARIETYDAIVLDLGLPEVDGLTLLRRWRDDGLGTPVLILTARASWHDKVTGIDSGADDYLAKPFRMEELLARVRALIRRSAGHASAELRCGAVVLDPKRAAVTVDGAPVKVTSHEYRVLSYLMHHRGRVVSQVELTEHIYAQNADRDSNTVEVFVARLRRKLGGTAIETVRGLGYRMADGH